MERERQALEAVEEARREQSVLSCARKDSARAAAELKRRHLEAAVYLEGPGPGGAIHTTYEAVREEAVLRVATETQKEHNQMVQEHGCFRNPASASTSSPTISPEVAVPLHAQQVSVMREACRAVESEVQYKLNQSREQLYSGGGSYGPSPAAEPSLAPAPSSSSSSPSSTPPGSAGGAIKLLGSQKGSITHEGLRRPDSWPGIFSFQK